MCIQFSRIVGNLFCPSLGRQREGPKINPLRKFFEKFLKIVSYSGFEIIKAPLTGEIFRYWRFEMIFYTGNIHGIPNRIVRFCKQMNLTAADTTPRNRNQSRTSTGRWKMQKNGIEVKCRKKENCYFILTSCPILFNDNKKGRTVLMG